MNESGSTLIKFIFNNHPLNKNTDNANAITSVPILGDIKYVRRFSMSQEHKIVLDNSYIFYCISVRYYTKILQ